MVTWERERERDESKIRLAHFDEFKKSFKFNDKVSYTKRIIKDFFFEVDNISRRKELNKMKKDIHPNYKKVKVICTSCGSVFESGSVLNEIRVDTCSNCHPFYVGTTSSSSLRGRAEKLSNKFDAGKQFKAKKTIVSANKTNKEGKTESGFGSL